MSDRRPRDPRRGRAGSMLPAWPGVLIVIAHPDDESFGLGAVIDRLTAAGAAVRCVCGRRCRAHRVLHRCGASTLNQTRADLHREREAELRRAAAELGRRASRRWKPRWRPGRHPGRGTRRPRRGRR